jgi:hypothetical protein
MSIVLKRCELKRRGIDASPRREGRSGEGAKGCSAEIAEEIGREGLAAITPLLKPNKESGGAGYGGTPLFHSLFVPISHPPRIIQYLVCLDQLG